MVVGCVDKQISPRRCDERLHKQQTELKKFCFRHMQRKKSLQSIVVVEALSLFLGNQHSCVLTAEMGVNLLKGQHSSGPGRPGVFQSA